MIARNFELELDASAGPVTELFSFTMRLRERVAGTPYESSHGHTYPGSESESEDSCPAIT
jgi:hypothetical protein